MTDLDFDGALEEGAIRAGSHFAQRASADADAARALAGAVLRRLPIGAADGEDEAAWAALGLTDHAEESIDLPGSEFDVPAVTAAEMLEDDAYADAWVPTAPQAVIAPRNRGWMWGVAATFLLGVGAFAAFFGLADDTDGQRFLTPASTASAAPATAAPASAAAVSTASGAAPASRAPQAPATMAVSAASLAPASAASSAAPKAIAIKTPRSTKRSTRRSPARPRAAAKDKPPVAAAPRTTAPKRTTRKANAEVDDLLGSLGGGGKPAKRAPRPIAAVVDPTLPAKLSKSQILRVVRANANKVSSCKRAGATGTVKVTMVIGRTGRVTSATPRSPFAGTPTGVCVAAKVRTFRFPQFSGDPMRINMPFRL